MWVLPSFGRPAMCAATIKAMRDHGSQAPGVVYVCEDDPDIAHYLAMPLPQNWQTVVMPRGEGWQPEKLNDALKRFTCLPWYGWIADDIEVQTGGFEAALVTAAGSWGIASANDLWQANSDVSKGRMHGATVFGGDLLRQLGYWVPDGFRHWYIEDVWERIGRELGNWRTLMHVVTEHKHPFRGGDSGDSTHARANTDDVAKAGRAAFDRWLSTQAPTDIYHARLAMWSARGLSLDDASKRSVMFGFPVFDGVNPMREAAVMDTVYLLGQFGIRSGHVHVVGQTIHQARNTIADAFMRSDFTDLFMIDADMSFSAWDVLKFLAAPHPLLAAVGRKRADKDLDDPESWCFSPNPEHGWVLPVDGHGMCEVAQVGTGFMRIRREVFEAVRDGNPDLIRAKDRERTKHYVKYFDWTDDGQDEIGEDITFCRRYVEAGGKIWIDPDVPLKHYGTKAWHGCLKDIMC